MAHGSSKEVETRAVYVCDVKKW